MTRRAKGRVVHWRAAWPRLRAQGVVLEYLADIVDNAGHAVVRLADADEANNGVAIAHACCPPSMGVSALVM